MEEEYIESEWYNLLEERAQCYGEFEWELL